MSLRTIILYFGLSFFLGSGCQVHSQFIGSAPSKHPVINEVMMNAVGGKLPAYEWVELYNPSDQVISMKAYTLAYNDRSFSLPDIFLSAKQYVIVVAASHERHLEAFGTTCGIIGWPRMSNTAATLRLSHQDDGLVDQLTYSSRWFASIEKRRGGWSLERINPSWRCNSQHAWSESRAERGGTPGRINSVYDLTSIPNLEIRDVLVRPHDVRVLLNMDVEDMLDLQEARLESEHHSISLRGVVQNDTIFFIPEQNIISGTLYTLRLQALFCGQNLKRSYPVFKSTDLAFNDVVINEVLYNPNANVPRFVEIYNRSDHIVNLQGWRLGSRRISDGPLFIYPRGYRIITTYPEVLRSAYPSSIIADAIMLPSLPAYGSRQGTVTLYAQDRLMDSLYYDETMHQPFLRDPKGISLERISFFAPTNQAGNFTSASTYSEGATPGYENSRVRAGTVSHNSMYLSSRIYTLSNGSWHIHYAFVRENTMVNLTIYDSKGRVINRLVRSQGVGYVGRFAWDGRNERGNVVKPGIYFVRMEIYHEHGGRQIFKESFVLRD